jgi:pimeloyl-ACP methyl ester carboxylesterase
VGCSAIVVFGHGDGGPIAMLFAATYPERTEALVLGDSVRAHSRHARPADYLDGHEREPRKPSSKRGAPSPDSWAGD